MARRAQIIITPEIVHQALMLPRELKPIEVSLDMKRAQVVAIVESDYLPDVDEGQPLPVITPKYTKVNKRVKLHRIDGYDGPLTRSSYRT